MSTETDDEWVSARFKEMNAIGVYLRVFSAAPGKSPRLWSCDAIINGSVYCIEDAATAREAVAKTIATVMAARLQGLKLRDTDAGDGGMSNCLGGM